MSKPPYVNNTSLLDLEEEIGIRKAKQRTTSILEDPIIAQELYETGEVFIFDPNKIDLPVFLVCKKTKNIKPLLSSKVNTLTGISFIKYIGDSSFLAIVENKILKIESRKIVWEYSGRNKNFIPITADGWADGLVVVVDGGNKQLEIIHPHTRNTEVWNIPEGYFIDPICIKALENKNVLITDRELQIVYELSSDGSVVWHHGTLGQPGNDKNQLTYPQSATVLSNNSVLITDSMNNRIIEVDRINRITWSHSNSKEDFYENNHLFYPSWSEETKSGNKLICDSRNQRVIEVNQNSEVVWEFGGTNVEQRLLSFPRSIQALDNKNILVADTSNNRIIEMNRENKVVWHYGSGEQASSEGALFWPRCAKRIDNDQIIISDGRNGRILLLSSDQKILRIVEEYYIDDNWYRLEDPHYFDILSNGNWLIVDSPTNTVVEIDENNHAKWVYKNDEQNKCSSLNDPHWAYRYEDNGNTIIADSANHRILSVSKSGYVNWALKEFDVGDRMINLYWPRCCYVLPNRTILIVDGGTGTIINISEEGNLIQIYDSTDHSVKSALMESRSIELMGSDVALISDTEGCRILKVRNAPFLNS